MTNLRNAGSPLQTRHFVVWWLIRICQFVDFSGFNPRQRIFFLKICRFDSSLFDSNSSGESLMNHFKYSLRGNKLQSKRLCIQTAVNQFPLSWIKPTANGRIIVCQQVPSLSDVTFYVRLHTLLHVVGSCCAKFETGQLLIQQLLTFLLFRDRRSVAQQCWIQSHSSSNIVGATHAHYTWSPKSSGLYPSHDALQVPTLLGVVASVCTPLPIQAQQLATMLGVVASVCT